ncbi:hypothetical protein ACH4TX_09735 [Streptomyces sp. NPDC021098]|uniref:hypothetical protein n=1 Tax=unclassified Streptomyces TaxID=2593676 RepID=UPI00379D997C
MPTRLIKILFRLGVLAFLLGGLCIVVGQALGLVLGDAAWVNDVASAAGPPTFITAGVTGLLAYVLTYVRPEESAEPAAAAAQQPAATAAQPE